MSDLKLFRLNQDTVSELEAKSVAMEKSLQNLIEKHLETLLGVRFLATEYSTGKKHKGRIDTLGLDENSCPVIFEYKRTINENVINQGLFYLDWLMDHKAEFELLVMNNLGRESAAELEWSGPRLICIAGDFTRYDEHAVQQINRNIELIRYRRFGSDLLLLELVNAVTVPTASLETSTTTSRQSSHSQKTISEVIPTLTGDLAHLYESIREFLMALGDDVQVKTLKYYLAFKRIKNFACLELRTQECKVILTVKIDPDTITLEKGFTRDVREIGHYGTGDLDISIRNMDDFEKAKPLLIRSYESS